MQYIEYRNVWKMTKAVCYSWGASNLIAKLVEVAFHKWNMSSVFLE